MDIIQSMPYRPSSGPQMSSPLPVPCLDPVGRNLPLSPNRQRFCHLFEWVLGLFEAPQPWLLIGRAHPAGNASTVSLPQFIPELIQLRKERFVIVHFDSLFFHHDMLLASLLNPDKFRSVNFQPLAGLQVLPYGMPESI